MQIRQYMEARGLTLASLLEKLKSVAEPGELDDVSLSTLGRHASGQHFPGARLQDLYSAATEEAVRPQDWVDLAREFRLSRKTGAPA